MQPFIICNIFNSSTTAMLHRVHPQYCQQLPWLHQTPSSTPIQQTLHHLQERKQGHRVVGDEEDRCSATGNRPRGAWVKTRNVTDCTIADVVASTLGCCLGAFAVDRPPTAARTRLATACCPAVRLLVCR